MDRGKYKLNKNFLKNNKYYNKLVNRIIFVLVILLIILVIKMMDNKTSNSIIKIIERNIYYDFSMEKDGKKVKDYLVKVVDSSKGTLEGLVEQFSKDIN
ncbi:hypothetical protein [Tissierella praeacuta]|uniref:Uncharacterized protein n=1 Tax=Tissierella praeacuta DSM 18095 TaxID=1123404 RepID=A0A1M4S6N2_9FIRM|nr:hypothetical protein [Tissierella praeacuta]MBU5256748.1 hypothetical protein [Tissierella praeacuta]TCU71659.1 hypothetical protein EV204_106123 [Tissierella praeacuta]SHE27858.1 hypothetical protein SAMN02745784_00102 [Tissierella praeacuta DSM 18095]SUP00996.1 Uncharacterised protein [Tissierella praeacuta]